MSKTQQTKTAIIAFFKRLKDNQRTTFRSPELIKFIRSEIKTKYFYPDTALRDLRQLRTDGVIDYECVNRKEMEYVVKKLLK